MFEIDSLGRHSLASLRKAVKEEFGIDLAKSYLDRLLKNPFYKGQFCWDDKLYSGHIPLVSPDRFDRSKLFIVSDSQRPFAIVIVGGLLRALLLLSIFLLPTLYV